MNNQNKINADEIDLGELIVSIWSGRRFILSVILCCILAGFIYSLIVPKTFSIKVELKPIFISEFEAFEELNLSSLFDLDRETLLLGVINELRQGNSLTNAMQEVNLLDRSRYDTEQQFEIMLARKAAEIEILPSIAQVGNEDNFWTLKFQTTSVDKSLAAIRLAVMDAEKEYQKLMALQFERKIALLKLQRSQKIEDISRKISNAIIDHDKNVSNRLAYLREQAEIARVVGVGKSVIGLQFWAVSAWAFAGQNAEIPFYLRGYEAIEKEIFLLENRTNKRAFVPDIVELEASQREIQQDMIIQRSEVAFKRSPFGSEAFSAAKYNVDEIAPTANFNMSIVLTLSMLIGLLLGLVALLFYNVIRARTLVGSTNI